MISRCCKLVVNLLVLVNQARAVMSCSNQSGFQNQVVISSSIFVHDTNKVLSVPREVEEEERSGDKTSQWSCGCPSEA